MARTPWQLTTAPSSSACLCQLRPEPQPSAVASHFGPSPRRPSPAPAPAARSSLVSFDTARADLLAAEQTVYSQVFSKLPGGNSGKVPLDTEELKNFFMINTGVDETELETEILKTGALDQGGMNLEMFMQFIRDNPGVTDAMAISDFLNISSDGQSASSQDCRSRLLILGKETLGAKFSEEQWESLFDTVMEDADLTVSMEQWIGYSKRAARIIEVLKIAEES
mmetsp:Transcript_78139/g.252990  ORF Transcript_78139/g.252990 Transcript_78139/m.252990 type:complete len:224 (-) Transcript_78139:207-878(-)